MNKTEVRLAYQQDTGLGLTTINKLVEDPQTETDAVCPECEERFFEGAFADPDLIKYITWLEEQVQLLLKLREIKGFKITPMSPATNIK